MKSFTDTKGNIWKIVINLGSAKRIYDETGVDLLNLRTLVDEDNPEESAAQKIISDDLFIGSVIAPLIIDQAKSNNVEEKYILDIFDGETLKAAHLAFLEEYKNFFTERGNLAYSEVIGRMMETMKTLSNKETMDKAMKDAEKQLRGKK